MGERERDRERLKNEKGSKYEKYFIFLLFSI
jgi:hypothetical protein